MTTYKFNRGRNDSRDGGHARRPVGRPKKRLDWNINERAFQNRLAKFVVPPSGGNSGIPAKAGTTNMGFEMLSGVYYQKMPSEKTAIQSLLTQVGKSEQTVYRECGI